MIGRIYAEHISKHVNRETISYLICGVLTTAIGWGSFAIAVHFGFGTATANAVSTALAVLFAYITNKIFVFRSPGWGIKLLVVEFGKFCGARLVTFIAETALLLLLVDVLGFNSTLMKGVSMVVVVIGNYVLSKWLVFRPV